MTTQQDYAGSISRKTFTQTQASLRPGLRPLVYYIFGHAMYTVDAVIVCTVNTALYLI